MRGGATIRLAVGRRLREVAVPPAPRPTELLSRLKASAVLAAPGLLIGGGAGFGARDLHCGLGSRGTTPESLGPLGRTPRDIFEANNKQAWVDTGTGFCHLCQEPLGSTVGQHIGDRDHTTMQFFLYLYTSYPRHEREGRPGSILSEGKLGGRRRASALATAQSPSPGRSPPPLWSPEAVIAETLRLCPSLHRYATTVLGMDHLHVFDDALRRAELEALLLRLTRPLRPPSHSASAVEASSSGSAGTAALSHVLQGKSPFGFWYSGERLWKCHITRIVCQIYPPASAGVMTNFTQKCWGRTNGERMYDALRLQRAKAMYGWKPYESKEKKAFFVRQLLWELLSVETRPEVDELSKHLAALAADRMAFEMIFLQSMEYMNRVQRVHELMGRPTLEELHGLNLL